MYTKYTHRRALSASLARISAVALLALAGASPMLPAHAGPDDGRIITTQGHVDAPKTYWENGGFALKNEANPYKTGADLYDLDKTVNWVGKGWDGRNGASQYTLTLTDSPNLRFLGEPGQTLYMAPTLTWGNHDPIWAGLGSSVKIPTEKFRDGIYATDILSVEGPGRMELFRYNPDEGPADVNRILSSTSTGWHSWLLSKGSHTHNTTTFTRPGRYVVTYRTVARGTDGSIIQSPPQKLVWQVGGRKPILGDGTPNAVPTIDRYNAAPVGNLDLAKYVLSVAPHKLDPDPAKNKDADDKLSDITFTAADKNLSGTLTLYNNGYFLTDLEVKNGTATWSEMMGGESSHLQAVFTPSGNEGARWISHKLAYEPGHAESVYSDDGTGDWPVEEPDERNTVLPTAQYTPASGDYTVRTVPSTREGYRTLEVTFADPNVRGFIRGGFYAPNDYEYPKFDIETTIDNGVARFTYREDSYFENSELIVKVLPHPDMNARTSQVKLTQNYQRGGDYSATGTLGADSPAANPQPGDSHTPDPQPSPSADPSGPDPNDALPSVSPAPAAPEKPSANPTPSRDGDTQRTQNPAPKAPAPMPTCEAGKIDGRYKIGDGHLDLQAQLRDNRLELGLKDDSGLIDADSVVRPLDTVVWTVSDRARRSRNEHMNSPKLDFIGPVGTAFYGLPQTQMRGLPWPGYSTQDVDYSRLDGGVTLHVVPRSMPKGARFGVFTESLTGPEVLLDSTKNQHSISIDYATHAHANWVFTEPGHYMFDVQYTAKLKDGTEITSKVQQLAVAVGNEASNACSFTAAPEPGKGTNGGSSSGQKTGQDSLARVGTPQGAVRVPNAPADAAHPHNPTEPQDASAAPQNGTEGTNPQGSEQAANSGTAQRAGTQVGATTENGTVTGSSGNGASGGSDSGASGVVQGSAGGASAGSNALAHTGFAVIPVVIAGVALLGTGAVLVIRRRQK